MYTSFRIQNFKGFKDLAFNEGDLARVNLIAGKNNTGKTSVLEAMLIHSGNDSLKATLRATEGQADWQSLFHKFNSESSIDFSARFRVEQSPDLKNDRYRRIESEFWTLSILLEGTVVKAYLNYSEQADQEHNYIDVTSRTASSSSLDIKSYRFTTFGLISLDF
ncbi:MAG: AAA family ATPase, partial [Chloroflexota bacterium]